MAQTTMAGAQAPRIPGPAGMVALLFCGHFAIIGLFSIGVDLPRIAGAFADVPHARLFAQLAGCVTGLSFALSAPLVGRLIERYGYRRIYIWSLLGFVAIGALPALLDNLYAIIVCRALFGLPVAASTTAAMSGLGGLPGAIRARTFGRSAVVSAVGTILIFPIVGALSAIGWRMGFVPCLFALALLPFVLALPREDVVPVSVHDRAPRLRGGLGVSPGLLAVTAFVGLMMFVGPMFAPFYLAAIGITDPKLASLPLSAMSFASLVTTSVFGRLHARFGTTALFGGILFLTGFGLTWAGLSISLWLFTGGLVTASFGLSLFKPNLGEAISAAAEGSPARGLGLAMSAMFVVQALLPFLSEGIRALLGARGVFLCFGLASLVLASGFVLAARGRKPVPARRPA